MELVVTIGRNKERILMEKLLSGISKFLRSLVAIFLLLANFSSISGLMHIKAGVLPTITYPDPGSVLLQKTKLDIGNGLYEITLDVSGIPVIQSTDIVLVIDISGSMEGSKLNSAKVAAKSFIDNIIAKNQGHRIAIVSFESTPSVVLGFSTNATELKDAIDNLEDGGGTHLEGGIRVATNLLTDNGLSTNSKAIVLLGDGEPTYGYEFDAQYIGDYETRIRWGFSCQVTVPESEIDDDSNFIGRFNFDYANDLGAGNSRFFDKSFTVTGTCSNGDSDDTTFEKEFSLEDSVYYQANIAKALDYSIFSIGLEVGTSGERILEGIQNSGYYNAEEDDLTGIYDLIASQIAYAARSAVVVDKIGDAFEFESIAPGYTSLDATFDPVTRILTWNVGNVGADSVILKYILRIHSGLPNGEYPTNEYANLSYIDIFDTPAFDVFPKPIVIINNTAPVAYDQAISTDEDTPLNITLTGLDADGDLLTFILLNTLTEPAHGTLTGSGASLVYTPDLNYVGSDSFTFKVNDGTLDSNTATISIKVDEINDAPEAYDQAISTDEDTPLNITLTGFDVDGDLLTFILLNTLTEPAHGTLTGSGASLVYTPDLNYVGSDSFTFKVNDGTLDSIFATISISVGVVNDAPEAYDQAISTDEDTPLNITLTGLDADGDLLTYILLNTLTEPAHGTLTGSGASLVYTPDLNYVGSDSFTFKVNDGTLDSNFATISIKVDAVNDAPVADDQNLSTPEDTTLGITLTGMDIDGDLLTYILLNTLIEPAHGTLTGSGASLVYTPDLNYVGFDSFTFKVNDGTLDSVYATIQIKVTAVNDAPVADDQNLSTPEDTTLNITLTGLDADGDLLTYILLNTLVEPAHGTLTGSGASLVYTPDLNYVGFDSFTFKVNDGTLDSVYATIQIKVTAVNDAPVADDDSFSVEEGGTYEDDVFALDPDGDLLTYFLVVGPLHGRVDFNPNGSYLYTHDGGETLVDSFTFRANDGTIDSNVATISINIGVENDAPVANNQTLSTPEDTLLNIILTGLDVDGDVLSYVLVNFLTEPAHGTLTGTGANLQYVPDSNYFGPDSFTFKVNDGIVDSNVATISITVTPLNDAPVANGDSFALLRGALHNGTLIVSDVDLTDTMTYIIVSGPTYGTVLINPDGTYRYTHNGTNALPDSFTYKVNDGSVDSNVATVSITVTVLPLINTPPGTLPEAITLDEGASLTDAVGGFDANGDPISFVLVSDVVNGTLIFNGNGTYTYTHNGTETIADSFQFRSYDGKATSAVRTAFITINPINDAPVAVNGEDETEFNTVLTGNIHDLISDVDSANWTLGLVVSVAHGTLVLNANGTFTYTPNTDFTGEDSFTFKANDGGLDSNIATYTISVNEEVIIEDPETPLSPLTYWWVFLLGLLFILIFFLRPNLKYALVDKNGKETVIRRHIFANGNDDLFIDINDKNIDGLVKVDLVLYKQLVKREQGQKVTFNLFKKPVKTIVIPEDMKDAIEDQIKL
jgi:VCBS repeat-containing protein